MSEPLTEIDRHNIMSGIILIIFVILMIFLVLFIHPTNHHCEEHKECYKENPHLNDCEQQNLVRCEEINERYIPEPCE